MPTDICAEGDTNTAGAGRGQAFPRSVVRCSTDNGISADGENAAVDVGGRWGRGARLEAEFGAICETGVSARGKGCGPEEGAGCVT